MKWIVKIVTFIVYFRDFFADEAVVIIGLVHI